MRKHTPGPWYAVLTGHRSPQWSIATVETRAEQERLLDGDGIDTTVAGIWNEAVDEDAECIANARLISAAPDLLAFVEVAVAATEGSLADHYAAEVLRGLRGKAIAILAKIGGAS